MSTTLAEDTAGSFCKPHPIVVKAPKKGTDSPPVSLTPCELRVLPLLSTHLTIAAIADQLGRRRSTVKTHVAHIYTKLAANSRAEAVARARETGLVADPAGSDPKPRKETKQWIPA